MDQHDQEHEVYEEHEEYLEEVDGEDIYAEEVEGEYVESTLQDMQGEQEMPGTSSSRLEALPKTEELQHGYNMRFRHHAPRYALMHSGGNASDDYVQNLHEQQQTSERQSVRSKPLFSMNLPELLSRSIPLPNSQPSFAYLCFSKDCAAQIAHGGYLYNINGDYQRNKYNCWQCCRTDCVGTVRSAPNLKTLRLETPHSDDCVPDDLQIRLRIAVYDLRLMAEFTDLPLETLHSAGLDKVRQQQPDLIPLWPSFSLLQKSLEEHRRDKLFRRRFEERKQLLVELAKQDREERAVFRRTKPFPRSICGACRAEFVSSEVCSHDALIHHLCFEHNSPVSVSTFTFEDPTLFEKWIKSLILSAQYKLKKVGIYDEQMYYLCQADDRQKRQNHSKGSIINLHCTSFVRVHNWREILQGDVKKVLVDYCLDHCFHAGMSPLPDTNSALVESKYSPEAFMRDLARKKATTLQLLHGGSSPYVSAKRLPSGNMGIQDTRYPPAPVMSNGFSPLVPSRNRNSESSFRAVSFAPLNRSDLVPGSRSYNKMLMEREDFDPVIEIEGCCQKLVDRVQHCRLQDVATKYLTRLNQILDDVMADPNCAPRVSVETQSQLPKSSKIRRRQTGESTINEPSTSSEATETLRRDISPSLTPGSVAGTRRQDNRPTQVTEAVSSAEESKEGIFVQRPEAGTVRQAMFLKRGENGEMIVVKRIIRKSRSIIPVGEEEEVQPSMSRFDQDQENVDEVATAGSSLKTELPDPDQGNEEQVPEMPANVIAPEDAMEQIIIQEDETVPTPKRARTEVSS